MPLAFERSARLLVVLHALTAAALVGAATHHLFWQRRRYASKVDAVARERRMAVTQAVLYLTTFSLGALLYPAYKIKVRIAWFDAHGLEWLSRLFDLKEHITALGLAAALVLAGLARGAHPSMLPAARPLYVGLSFFVSLAAWSGALIGLVAASYRFVGGLP